MSENAFPDALAPGYRLHWYVLEQVLGQGGFGITYLARDTNLDQPVAIKEYLPVEVAGRRSDSSVRARTEEHDERYRWGLDRFLREARTLARFDHPNIVRVLSVFEFNNTAYMVMRFERGETLAALLERRHALPEAELLRVLMPILDGLELVHNAGFIHRDIKPDNILIRDDGTPVLLDFGSARYALGRSRTVTILVAPGYAPFEQYYSSGENQGAWTDIYGLGATCYRAIAGRAPLDAITRSKGILGSTKEVLVPANAVGSGRYSERLLKAIDHALAFAENERPQNIAAWRQELPPVTSGSATPVTPQPAPTTRTAPPPATVTAPPSVPPPTPTTAERARRAWSSTRGPLLWGGAGAVAVIIALAAAQWQKPAPPPPAAPPAPQGPDTSELLKKFQEQFEQERQKLQQERERLQRERKEQEQQARAEEERKRKEAEKQARVEQQQRKKSPPPPPVARPEPVRPVSAPPPAPVPVAPAPAVRAEPPSPPPPPVAVVPAPAPKPPAPPTTSELLARADGAVAKGAYEDAAAILKPLAEKQNSRAMVKLGNLHLDGKGVERNDQEALRLFTRAASRGDGEAQFKAGEMYAGGRGAARNDFQAYVYLTAAVQSGVQAAKAPQERVGALLQPAERAQAAKLAETLNRKDRL
ncbi:MAG TPA: serine/threonine-protein kinase [Burkholderiales bacterium]|nr:serine/threonine-protein kinase [Burkholderiales bacterium]